MAIAAAVAALLLVLVLARHAIAGGVLQAVLSSATGYQIRWGNQKLGTGHAAFFDVHVVKNGDPVLDAKRVDVEYALRDVFPGGRHKFGFAAISIQEPVLTVTRHADGSLSFTRGGTSATPPGATKQAATPYFFTARVRNGVVRLIDRAPLQPDLANQTLENVAIDASVNTDARTTAKLDGVLLGRRVQNGPVGRYPLSIRVNIDKPRGFALAALRARELPLRGVMGFAIHSNGVRFDDGQLEGTDARVYALLANDAQDFAYRIGGSTTMNGGRLAIGALLRPLRDLHGPVAITDSALASTALSGTLGGVPVVGRGAIYDLFGQPRMRVGLGGTGDLHELRSLFAFSSGLPLSGRAHVETLLASHVNNPLVRTWLDAPAPAYGPYALSDAHSIVDFYLASVLVHGTRARYGGTAVATAGTVDFTDAGIDMQFALHADGAGVLLPYADVLAPDAHVLADAIIAHHQGDAPGFTARGALAAIGPTHGAMAFAVDQRGVGEFGPFMFARDDGSMLAGGFELQRPISASGGWVHATHFRLADVAAAGALPGAAVPALPPLSGVLDGDLAGAGTPDAFAVAGHVEGRDIHAAGFALGDASVTLAGTLDDVQLAALHLAGPLGRFDGSGAYANGLLAIDGRYDGTLEQLRPVTRDASARGEVHGPVRMALANGVATVQSSGADLRAGSYRGVPVERVAGTLRIDGSSVRVLAADASLGGGARIVAADVGGGFLLSAPDISAVTLRGAGVPLDAGKLSLFGVADLRGAPRFDGTVALEHGRVHGYPVAGIGDVALNADTAYVRQGTGALGKTYGSFSGGINGLGSTMGYDLHAKVAAGDIGEVRGVLRIPVRYLDGSFSADLRVRGSGVHPIVDGAVRVPEGSYNGLDFRDAGANVALTPTSAAARDGFVTVGSTHAQVAASVAGRAFAVSVRSAAADLTDFNDYFDEAETLAGRGRLAVAFANDGRRTRTSGSAAIANLRVRRFAFGTTNAAWTQTAAGGPIDGTLAVRGAGGTLDARGRILPASGGPLAAFEHAAYRGSVVSSGVDLSTWLPAFGISAPVLGLVDASLSVAGTYPRLNVSGDARLRNGSLFGFAAKEAHVRAASDGARIALADGVLDLDFARFDLSGAFGLSERDPLALDVRLRSSDLAKTMARLFPHLSLDIAGAVTADARIGGTLLAPRANVGFEMDNARYASLTIPRVLGNIGYDGHTLDLRDIEATLDGGTATLAGTLPVALEPPGVRPAAPLSFTLALQRVSLAPFAPFLPGSGTKLAGTVDGRLAVEGTTSAPRVIGNLALRDGSYASSLDRAGVRGANADLGFDGTSVTLRALHANLGAGTLDGSGRLDLPIPGTPKRGYTVTLVAKGARLDNPQFGRGTVDGTMTLASAEHLPLLSGDVTLSNASIPFTAVYRSGSGPAAGGEGRGLNVAFDVHAHSGKNVRVQSSILDIGATGALDLTGTLQSPKLAGELAATPGGYFTTYNRAFRVQQATVRFDPAQGIVPYIDLRAFTHVTNPDPDPTRNAIGSADITIIASGPADELATGSGIEFTSNPNYSREQIVGLLADLSVLGAVNFNSAQNGTTLRGAPGESNALLPPGVTPYQAGVLNFNQEAFSLLNTQVTQRFLAPIERVLIERLGVSDFEITVDYGGGIGYNVLKQLGHRDVYASFGQTLSSPLRTTLGFTARPDPFTSVNFNYYDQSFAPALTNNANGTQAFTTSQRLNGIRPVGNRKGFTFQIIRKYP